MGAAGAAAAGAAGCAGLLPCQHALRAFVCTDAASLYTGVINNSKVINYMNSVERTVLFANLKAIQPTEQLGNYILTHILGGALYFLLSS